MSRVKTPISGIKAGDFVKVDKYFDCCTINRRYEVLKSPISGDLCIACDSGYHNLDGQIDFDKGTHYVGIEKVS